MIIFKNKKKRLSLRERFARMNEDEEEKLPVDIDSEDNGEVTITLSPSDIAILQKVLTRVAVCSKPAGEDDGETCPGCDDPNCPDCNPNGAEEAPADDGVDEFEVPDVSELEDSREEDELNYFS